MSTASSHSSYSSPYWSERGEHRTSGDSGISSVSVIHSPTRLPIASKFSPTSSSFSFNKNNEYTTEHLDTDANCVTMNHNNVEIYWYRYIFRTKELPDERGILSGPVMPPFGDPPWDDLLKMISKDICNRRLTKFITTPKLGIEILNFDETRVIIFGVLYCAPNQTTEEEWFSNTTTSKYFDDFLSILGAKVRLLGFEGFGGGLDTRTDGTGEYSLYDNGTWKDFEIMYHVSTMLPYDKVDRHQIVRKRHIGNDTFRPFSPASIRSKFLHVFVIVSPVQLENGKVVSKDSVPYFGPPLPDPPIFDDTLRLKKFLIAAVINGQNAAWKTAQLAEPFLRARRGIIENITNRLVPNPKNRIDNNESKTSAENVHKKPTQEELDHTLRRLFVEQLKSGGPPPDIVQVQTLLKQGANPNIKIPQPKSSKPKPKPSNQLDSSNYHRQHHHNASNYSIFHLSSNSISSLNSHSRSVSSSTYLICSGTETMPKDTHFPNAFVYAARLKRVATMTCLLESVPSLSDPESVDAAINERIIEPSTKPFYGIWYGLTGEVKKLREQITGR
ncbi:23120_t:CDS:2 [Entrophospora sp. SA101]|nr:2745_t:CDS:2 [Entrophospora sp. SA101]CAJ0752673.1 23120_t:CDS:2 [Entrophospora sp. SA101]